MAVKFKSNLDKYFKEQIEEKFPDFKEINCPKCKHKATRVDRDHFKCGKCSTVIQLRIDGKK